MNARFAFIAVACAACQPFGPDKSGDNGNGSFQYNCTGATDPTCQGAEVLQTFPDEIALGAVFGVSFVATGGAESVVQSAASALLRFDSGNFRATAPGYAGLLVLNGDGRVVDFTHVLLAPATSYAILQSADTPALAVMAVGTTQTVFASPRDDNGFAIAGAVPATWSVSDATILELVETSPAVSMTLNAKALGQATLTVTAGTITRTIDITVEAP